MYLGGMFNRGYFWLETQRTAKSWGPREHMHFHRQPREKGAFVSAEVEKTSEKMFLFGTRKPLFLGMC